LVINDEPFLESLMDRYERPIYFMEL
jgi:hypothetical protein